MAGPDERPSEEIDREFDAIVAGLDVDLAGVAPTAEPLDDPAVEPSAEPSPDATEAPASTSSWLVVPAEVWRGPTTSEPIASTDDPQGLAEDAGEDEEGFEPPPVELPAAEDLSYWGAVVGIVAGPLLVFYGVYWGSFKQWLWVGAGLVAFVGGFALMLTRQPAHRDPDDPDDGTRV